MKKIWSLKGKNLVGDGLIIQVESEGKIVSPWKGQPLGFMEFFRSEEHMDFPALSEKQEEFCAAGLTQDPKETFNSEIRENDILTACVGKGGGKDALAVNIACYLAYVLDHLRDPFEYLYGARVAGEPIDIVIVAPRGKTSKKVTFEKLRQRVRNWNWMREKYDYRESGRMMRAKERQESDNYIDVGADAITFPGNIRVFALTSNLESAEGFNLIAFICTEFAGFVDTEDKPNAEKIYRVLHTSAKTRFPKKFLGMLISYPRYDGDPILNKVEESKTKDRMFAMKCPTWEFNPIRSREEFEDELNSEDPVERAEAWGKYACQPGAKETMFVGDKDRILQCVSKRPQAITLIPKIEVVNNMKMLRMVVDSRNVPRQPSATKYVARVDLGKNRDRCSLAVAHYEDPKVVVDLLVQWVPDPIKKVVADVDDPCRVILWLKKNLFNITYVTYDMWNSQSSINKLNRRGITTEVLSLRAREYDVFLTSMYIKNVDLLDFYPLVDPKAGELFHLTRNKQTGKVDHEEGYHNDVTEAACGVVAMLKGTKKNIDSLPAGYSNVKPNLHSIGGDLWASDDPDDPLFGNNPNEPPESDDIFPGSGASVRLR